MIQATDVADITDFVLLQIGRVATQMSPVREALNLVFMGILVTATV